jgi:flagellar hook-basal body complex protein FliE
MAAILPVSSTSVSDLISAASSAPKSSGSFKDVLTAAVGQVESSGKTASDAVSSVLNGETEDLHTAILATQRAELTFEMFMQVRNKVVGAYQEIMKMAM